LGAKAATVPDTIIRKVMAASSSLRSSRPASGAMNRLVTRANAPDTEIAWPAWPSLMCKSAATGVSRLTGMNSEATSANAPSAIAKTAPHAAGLFSTAACSALMRISMMLPYAASVALSITKRYARRP
jgi:hypothetical protein